MPSTRRARSGKTQTSASLTLAETFAPQLARSAPAPARRQLPSLLRQRGLLRDRRDRHGEAAGRVAPPHYRRRKAEALLHAFPVRVALGARPDGRARRYASSRAVGRLEPRAFHERQPQARFGLGEAEEVGTSLRDCDDAPGDCGPGLTLFCDWPSAFVPDLSVRVRDRRRRTNRTSSDPIGGWLKPHRSAVRPVGRPSQFPRRKQRDGKRQHGTGEIRASDRGR
jgi:hypothetical protein